MNRLWTQLRHRQFTEGLVAVVIVGACFGCASSSYRSSGTIPHNKQVVIVANDVRFRPLLQGVLESHGFRVVPNGTPSALKCIAKYEGFTFMEAQVSLWNGPTKLVSGKASNPGFGTWLRHDAAKEGVIANAVQEFDNELGLLEWAILLRSTGN